MVRRTALKKFQRLEAAGLWHRGGGRAPVEVVVSVGEATLVLSDPKTDAPVAHWSLPALERLNPGEIPARFAPAALGGEPGDAEYLALDDAEMLDAIDQLHRAIEDSRPHPGRLRGRLTIAAALLMAGLAIFWLPGALTRHAAQITPAAERASIGGMVLADLVRSTGAPCQNPQAQAILDDLARRMAGPQSRVLVLPQRFEDALPLPGDLIAVPRDLVTGEDSPDALAGHLIAARQRAGSHPPLVDALDHVRLRDILTLLTSGHLPQGALDGYGETLLSAPAKRLDETALLAAFTQRQVPTTPYAQSLDRARRPNIALIEADPFRQSDAPALMSDQDWVLAQQICAG
ncbi:MAG: hypothetical protein Q4F71_07890 [Paracoccus sp. (in: a-proteobacteria)]|nr:hypothetical protein [Paracoccus sp. (in: a-proteobacteria)]